MFHENQQGKNCNFLTGINDVTFMHTSWTHTTSSKHRMSWQILCIT